MSAGVTAGIVFLALFALFILYLIYKYLSKELEKNSDESQNGRRRRLVSRANRNEEIVSTITRNHDDQQLSSYDIQSNPTLYGTVLAQNFRSQVFPHGYNIRRDISPNAPRLTEEMISPILNGSDQQQSSYAIHSNPTLYGAILAHNSRSQVYHEYDFRSKRSSKSPELSEDRISPITVNRSDQQRSSYDNQSNPTLCGTTFAQNMRSQIHREHNFRSGRSLNSPQLREERISAITVNRNDQQLSSYDIQNNPTLYGTILAQNIRSHVFPHDYNSGSDISPNSPQLREEMISPIVNCSDQQQSNYDIHSNPTVYDTTFAQNIRSQVFHHEDNFRSSRPLNAPQLREEMISPVTMSHSNQQLSSYDIQSNPTHYGATFAQNMRSQVLRHEHNFRRDRSSNTPQRGQERISPTTVNHSDQQQNSDDIQNNPTLYGAVIAQNFRSRVLHHEPDFIRNQSSDASQIDESPPPSYSDIFPDKNQTKFSNN